MTNHSPETTETTAPGQSAADDTLGGYFEVHERPPAFEGPDGHPYSVSIEIEKTPDLAAPFHAYLVFPRWAETGVGIVGHVETDILVKAKSEGDAQVLVGALSLVEVKARLDEAIAADQRRRSEAEPGLQSPKPPTSSEST